MNTELLLKVKDQILKEPKQFYMGDWVTQFLPWVIPNCGTAACIGGWTVAIQRRTNPNALYGIRGAVEIEAALALELTSEQAERLFYKSNWPEQFINSYTYRESFTVESSIEKVAQLAANRIDHFIATEGEE